MSEQKKSADIPVAVRILNNLLLVGLVVMYFFFWRPGTDPESQLGQCGKNLHEISVLLERERLGSRDGLYPEALTTSLFKDEVIPSCPLGDASQYTEGYKVSSQRESYELRCSGTLHAEAGVPAGYPRVSFSIAESKGETLESSAAPTPSMAASPPLEDDAQTAPTPAMKSPEAQQSNQASAETVKATTPTVEVEAKTSPSPTQN